MKRALLALCLMSTVVSAQTEPSEEAMKAADELTTVMGMNKSQMTAMPQLVEGMARRMNLSEADTDELKGIYDAWFSQDLDQAKIKQETKKLYAQAFTVEEMKEIATFYQTPLGKKMLVTSPMIAQTAQKLSMQEAQSKQHLLQARLQPFLEKHGLVGPGGAPVAPGGPMPKPPGAPVPPPAPKQ